MAKHPNDMTWQELRDLVSAMSWAALDLSQHLNFTNEMLKEEYKANAYKRAESMAGAICSMPYKDHAPPGQIDMVIFGADGLTRPDAPNA